MGDGPGFDSVLYPHAGAQTLLGIDGILICPADDCGTGSWVTAGKTAESVGRKIRSIPVITAVHAQYSREVCSPNQSTELLLLLLMLLYLALSLGCAAKKARLSQKRRNDVYYMYLSSNLRNLGPADFPSLFNFP